MGNVEVDMFAAVGVACRQQGFNGGAGCFATCATRA